MSSATRSIVIGLAAAATLWSAAAVAADDNQGYLVDNEHALVKNSYGQCWRTGYWTPAMANEACDPDLVKKPAAPTPPPPAPQAEEKPAPAPMKMLPQKINFSGDALFDFDKAVLKPEGKDMLDGLAETLQGANYEVVMAIGHTDRIGTNAYNQKLSERRAAAVKKYLEGKGIPANKIFAEGKGKKDPVTKPGQCKGLKWKQLVACLAPDRRVDVDVTGSKEVK